MSGALSRPVSSRCNESNPCGEKWCRLTSSLSHLCNTVLVSYTWLRNNLQTTFPSLTRHYFSGSRNAKPQHPIGLAFVLGFKTVLCARQLRTLLYFSFFKCACELWEGVFCIVFLLAILTRENIRNTSCTLNSLSPNRTHCANLCIQIV